MANVTNSSNRNNDLAMIHIAKAQLGLDDDTYRSMLYTLARVYSAADLDYAGRMKVLEHMKSKGGFKSASSKPAVNKQKQALIGKIAALIADMKLTWAYVDGIAKQMYKRDKVQWCTPYELRGIVTALIKKQEATYGKS